MKKKKIWTCSVTEWDHWYKHSQCVIQWHSVLLTTLVRVCKHNRTIVGQILRVYHSLNVVHNVSLFRWPLGKRREGEVISSKCQCIDWSDSAFEYLCDIYIYICLSSYTGPNFIINDLPSMLILIIADQISYNSLCCSNKYNCFLCR